MPTAGRMPVTPWVTVACAAASAASLGLHWAGVPGPWLPVCAGSGGASEHTVVRAAALRIERKRDDPDVRPQRRGRVQVALLRRTERADDVSGASQVQ